MTQLKEVSQVKRQRIATPPGRDLSGRRRCLANASAAGPQDALSETGGGAQKLTIRSLLQEHYKDFATRHPISSDMHRAAMMLQMCRTAALGGHVNSCPNEHFHQIAYNSCRHRCCPQCGWIPRERWLYGWKNRLLACPHHHCVFTLPHQLNPIWRYNKSAFNDLLFRASSETLRELLGDEKYLGGRVGLLCALHTWKQSLDEHVHLHVLVTAGGLGPDGQWLWAKRSCLLPCKVLMIKFRGKFKALLRQAIRRGDLQLPPSLTPAALESLLRKLTRVKWNVRILERYDSGIGVATYLAGYLKGGAIGNSRLIKVEDGQVYFRYRLGTHEGGDGKRRGVMGLPIDQFIGRLLEHVPPRRFQAVRGYGLYSGNQHSRLAEARALLGQSAAVIGEPKNLEAPLTWQQWCEQAGQTQACRCPKCGATLISHGHFPPGRAPPLDTIRSTVEKEAA
jgi:hypothetical protein